MKERILADDPKAFVYQEPVGKTTSAFTLVAFLITVISGIALLVQIAAKDPNTQFALVGFILGVVGIFTVPAVAAKRTMDVRAAFSSWSVLNHGLTPLEFLAPKMSTYRAAQSAVENPEVAKEQKFMNAAAEVVLVEVQEDRTSEDGHIRISLGAVRKSEETNPAEDAKE